jgi:alkanesulfonate monooxygenase SsuD/methylene tetrahydromethanopterin reductase-like flavin-dependent oxidoreductase (luciferase family)
MAEFGVLVPSASGGEPDLGFADTAGLAAAAEASGFASVWVRDPCPVLAHPAGPNHQQLEAYTLLGALAARTSRVQLGALVSDVTCRHPSILAKLVTTLDVIAGGRAVLGLGSPGAGHQEGEPGGAGGAGDVGDVGDRSDLLDEAVRLCKALFADGDVSFAGRHFRLDHACNLPPPIRPGGPGILLEADDQTLPLIARSADLCTVTGDAGMVARTVEELRRRCGQIGRDPAGIGVAWLAPCRLTPPDGVAGPDGPGGEGEVPPPADTSCGAATGAVVGPADRVPELVADHLAAGADSVIFDFGSVDAATIAAVGRALNPAAR